MLPIIKIYTAPYCNYSHAAKNFLTENGVVYEEVDVTMDIDAYHEMVDKSHQSAVPVIEAGHHIFAGFNKQELKEVLNIKEG